MLEEDGGLDWYGILNCSITSTKEEIISAGRSFSKKYHPDKNKDPAAVQLFLNVQKAKDFLLDDEKRRAYDEVIKKKVKRKEYDQQRDQHMNQRRKKMREELEKNVEKVAGKSTNSVPHPGQSVPKSSSQDKERQKDVDSIRQDAINRMNELRARQEAELNNISMEEILKHQQSMSDSINQESIVQIKVKWRRSDVSHSDDSLCSLFRIFGSIEDVTMSVGGKTNTAIITFATNIAAQAAVDHYLDSTTLKVVLLSNEPKKASIFTHNYQNTTTAGTIYTQSNNSHSSSTERVESDLMREVRRAVERDELIKQMASFATTTSTSHSSSSSPLDSQNNPSISSFTSSTTSSTPTPSPPSTPINFAAKENDILARMMAAKSAKSTSAVPMKAA